MAWIAGGAGTRGGCGTDGRAARTRRGRALVCARARADRLAGHRLEVHERRRRRLRTMEEESLHEMHAELLHRLELLRPFHTFRDHHRAMVVGETDHRLHEVLLDEVRVDAGDERDVELDEVRLEVGDRAESGVAAPGVVHGEAEPLLAEGLE